MTYKSTCGTVELSLVQGHVCYVSAFAAGFACVSWIYPDNFSTACYCLVGEHHGELVPRSIVNVFGETVIFDHILDFQIFYRDGIVFFDKHVGGLMQEVIALVADFEMPSGNLEPSLPPVIAPLLLPAETAHKPSQTMLRPHKDTVD